MSQGQQLEETSQGMSWEQVFSRHFPAVSRIRQVKYTDTKAPQYTVRIFVHRTQHFFQYDVQPLGEPRVRVVTYAQSNYLRLGFLAMIAAMKEILGTMNTQQKQVPKPTIRFVFQNRVYRHYIDIAGRLAAAQKLDPHSRNNQKRKPQNMDLILRFLLLNQVFSIRVEDDDNVYNDQLLMRRETVGPLRDAQYVRRPRRVSRGTQHRPRQTCSASAERVPRRVVRAWRAGRRPAPAVRGPGVHRARRQTSSASTAGRYPG